MLYEVITVLIADNFFARFKGLMLKKSLNEIDALCIEPCNSIHTFFMRFDIDVIFIDKNGVIIKIVNAMKPSRVTPIVRRSVQVIETQGGFCKKKQIEVGMLLKTIT